MMEFDQWKAFFSGITTREMEINPENTSLTMLMLAGGRKTLL
jgi:hypothetical protein